MTAKLGKIQRLMLNSLHDHGGVWHPGCGWIWDNRSGTIRLLESLVRRGLVRRENAQRPLYRIIGDVKPWYRRTGF